MAGVHRAPIVEGRYAVFEPAALLEIDAETLDGLDSTAFLQVANDLSDVADVATARTNLSVYSIAEAEAAFLDQTEGDARYSQLGHTHVEADITDLDKYTQAQVDVLLAAQDELDELADVVITTAADGEVLTWDSGTSRWVNEAIPPSGATELDGLDDVVITAPADNEVLAFDTASGDWINQTAAEAGLSATGHSHTESDITDLGDYVTVGGDTLGSTLRIGTNDAWPLELETNATTRVSITNAGKMSLGADPKLAPDSWFHIRKNDTGITTAPVSVLLIEGSGLNNMISIVGVDNADLSFFSYHSTSQAGGVILSGQFNTSRGGILKAETRDGTGAVKTEALTLDNKWGAKFKAAGGVANWGQSQLGDVTLDNDRYFRGHLSGGSLNVKDLIGMGPNDVIRLGGVRAAATTPGNFSADFYIKFEDENGNNLFIPAMNAAW